MIAYSTAGLSVKGCGANPERKLAMGVASAQAIEVKSDRLGLMSAYSPRTLRRRGGHPGHEPEFLPLSAMTRFLAFAFIVLALVATGCETQPGKHPPTREDVSQQLARLRFDGKSFDVLLRQSAREAFVAVYPDLRVRFQRELSPSEDSQLQQIIRQVLLEVYPQALWEKEVSAVYARYFTSQELEEMVRFYASPIGVKIRQVESNLAAEEIAATQQMIRGRLDRVGRRISEELRRQGFGESLEENDGRR